MFSRLKKCLIKLEVDPEYLKNKKRVLLIMKLKKLEENINQEKYLSIIMKKTNKIF
jgi:hypothetical protein